MKEAYVSFKTAKLLKEKGFDEECYRFYEYNTMESYKEDIPCCNSKSDDYSAPTHQMACAWLREEKGIFFCVHPDYPISKNYMVEFYDNGVPSGVFGNYEDYNEAVEAALKYSLENLI